MTQNYYRKKISRAIEVAPLALVLTLVLINVWYSGKIQAWINEKNPDIEQISGVTSGQECDPLLCALTSWCFATARVLFFAVWLSRPKT